MHIQRIDDAISRVSPIERQIVVGPGQHDCLGTLLHHHSLSEIEQHRALFIVADTSDGNVLVLYLLVNQPIEKYAFR